MLTRYFTPSTLFSRRRRLDLFFFERQRTPPRGTRPGTKTIPGGARDRIGFRPENSGEGERRRIDDGGRRRVPAVCRAALAELGRSRTRAPGRTRGAPGGAARRVPRRGGREPGRPRLRRPDRTREPPHRRENANSGSRTNSPGLLSPCPRARRGSDRTPLSGGARRGGGATSPPRPPATTQLTTQAQESHRGAGRRAPVVALGSPFARGGRPGPTPAIASATLSMR